MVAAQDSLCNTASVPPTHLCSQLVNVRVLLDRCRGLLVQLCLQAHQRHGQLLPHVTSNVAHPSPPASATVVHRRCCYCRLSHIARCLQKHKQAGLCSGNVGWWRQLWGGGGEVLLSIESTKSDFPLPEAVKGSNTVTVTVTVASQSRKFHNKSGSHTRRHYFDARGRYKRSPRPLISFDMHQQQ